MELFKGQITLMVRSRFCLVCDVWRQRYVLVYYSLFVSVWLMSTYLVAFYTYKFVRICGCSLYFNAIFYFILCISLIKKFRENYSLLCDDNKPYFMVCSMFSLEMGVFVSFKRIAVRSVRSLFLVLFFMNWFYVFFNS